MDRRTKIYEETETKSIRLLDLLYYLEKFKYYLYYKVFQMNLFTVHPQIQVLRKHLTSDWYKACSFIFQSSTNVGNRFVSQT